MREETEYGYSELSSSIVFGWKQSKGWAYIGGHDVLSVTVYFWFLSSNLISGRFCFFEQIIDDDGVVTNQNLIDSRELKDAEARIIIYCNVETDLQVLIEGCTQAVDMWER